MCLFVFAIVSVSASVCLSEKVCEYLSVSCLCEYKCVFVYLPFNVYLPFCLPVCPSDWLPVSLFDSLCLSLCQSISLSVPLSAHRRTSNSSPGPNCGKNEAVLYLKRFMKVKSRSVSNGNIHPRPLFGFLWRVQCNTFTSVYKRAFYIFRIMIFCFVYIIIRFHGLTV